ncbi:hypothetical protein, partial [Streptococcus acidominimus]
AGGSAMNMGRTTLREAGQNVKKGFDNFVQAFAKNGDEVAGSSRSSANARNGMGNYRSNRKLPRDRYGNPIPDVDRPHTQIGTKKGRRETYTQSREWNYDSDGNLRVERDIDFTDHGRPLDHHNPHQHNYIDNPTGGTRQRLGESELKMP